LYSTFVQRESVFTDSDNEDDLGDVVADSPVRGLSPQREQPDVEAGGGWGKPCNDTTALKSNQNAFLTIEYTDDIPNGWKKAPDGSPSAHLT
jgi:hypothetical protein